MNEFSNDIMVRNVLYMLDWGARKIELFPNKENYVDRFASVDRDILNEALIYHQDRIKENDKDRFSEVEVAIRDNFDQFLNYLERFDNFIVAKLISKEEIEPYLRYWLETISTDLSPTTKQALFNYINKYDFKGTIRLLKRFDIDILHNPEHIDPLNSE